MGLDCSHDAFHGAYSAFNRFRQVVAKAMGGSWPPHDDPEKDDQSWYWGDGFSEETHSGLFLFMSHSDCDGEFTPEECKKVADDLEVLLPEIQKYGAGDGHILRGGGYLKVAKTFIRGCRKAYSANEELLFR